MKIYKAIFVIIIVCSVGSVYANSSEGKIAKISSASIVATTSRPGSTQFSIEGGFSEEGCNSDYAAIHNDDAHLLSLLYMAKAQDHAVRVFLDSADKYHSDRCLVSYLEID